MLPVTRTRYSKQVLYYTSHKSQANPYKLNLDKRHFYNSNHGFDNNDFLVHRKHTIKEQLISKSIVFSLKLLLNCHIALFQFLCTIV